VQVDSQNQEQVGYNMRADGCKPIFNEVWLVSVPPKVRIFGWRLSQEGFATQANRKKRTLTKDATCQVYGMEEETGYHATVWCIKVVALRHKMRNCWTLPDESQSRYNGPDWLIIY
jgi:hypothetical protein